MCQGFSHFKAFLQSFVKAKLTTSSIRVNPYAAGDKFVQYKMMHKISKIIETLANWYSSESAQRDLSNEYQYDRV